MGLEDFALALPDPDQRQVVLAALAEAEQRPIEAEILDEIEARYGNGIGQVDLEAFMAAELTANAKTDEFRALMTAARLVRIRVAFVKPDPSAKLYVRLDKLQ